MCFNRVRFLGIGTAVLAALLGCGSPLRAAAGQAQIIDQVAAVINERIVTLIDVRVAESFGIFEGAPPADSGQARMAVLEKLIDIETVLDLARDRTFIDPARIETEIDRIAARLGEDGFRSRLAEFGFARADLKPYIEKKLLVETVIGERFGRSVTVSLKEIEARYQDRIVPADRSAGREPRPFLSIVDALEKEIKAEKIAVQAALWIQALRDQAEIEIRPGVLKK
jgi:hypothetical protein